jgi:hypothetical protein
LILGSTNRREATMLRGGCFCHAVRYEIEGEPLRATGCHCTICRHTSGAPYVAWFVVPRASLRWRDAAPSRLRSSEDAIRTFCPSCGTPLTFESTVNPDEIDVTTCSLDEPEKAPPQDHVFVRSRLSWIRLDDDLPRFPGSRFLDP